jgi:phage protein D
MTAVTPAERRIVAQIYIKLDGEELAAEALPDLLSARFEGSVHLPDLAVLDFRNPDLRWTEAQLFKIGQTLEVQLGETDLRERVFIGEVTGIELDVAMSGATELRVRAYDRAHRLHRGRFTQVYRNMTDSDIAKKIGQELGFTVDVTPTREVFEYVLQDNQTNWEFLQDRANRLGFELQVRDKTLVFKPPPSDPADPIDLAWREELLSFRARMITGEQVQDVEVRGWDPINKRALVGRAATPKGTPQIAESRTGGEVTRAAFQKKAPFLVARQPIYSQSQADSLAQTVLNELAGSFVTAEGIALGNPKLRLGSEVNLLSVGKQFSGRYVVTQIAHVYEPAGYRIEFEVTGRRSTDLASLTAGPAQPNAHILTGVVTNNKDPRDIGRVKVKLPTLGADVESNWCRVASPGAGKDRGMEYLPEVDDEVLLLGSDINHLYVIGGVWSTADSPPLKNSQAVSGGEVVKRIIRSRTGHEITLDDSPASPSITIVDSTGNNRLAIDTRKNSLEIDVAGDIKIKASQNIDIEAGMALSFQSGMGLEVQAGLDAKLTANTQLVLEGMLSTNLRSGGQVALAAPSVALG